MKLENFKQEKWIRTNLHKKSSQKIIWKSPFWYSFDPVFYKKNMNFFQRYILKKESGFELISGDFLGQKLCLNHEIFNIKCRTSSILYFLLTPFLMKIHEMNEKIVFQ